MARSARSSTTRMLYAFCSNQKTLPSLFPSLSPSPQPGLSSLITSLLLGSSQVCHFSAGSAALRNKEEKEGWWRMSMEKLGNIGISAQIDSGSIIQCAATYCTWNGYQDMPRASGIPVLPTVYERTFGRVCSRTTYQLTEINGANTMLPCFTRSFASKASDSARENRSESRKDVSTVEDPFDAPTYNIPERPVTFTEGASYSVVILAGLGIAAAAAYAVFKELIFEPKEYKIFNKALERIQNDSQVKVRIGSPITGYGQESRNRAARQRIPNKTWTDEDGIEHVEVNFYVRGPHGAGKVYTEMFKDQDKQWKFTYLIVEIKSPSPAHLMLESYVPA